MVWVMVLAPAVMAVPMAVIGAYWYVRAAIYTGGNPIPITKFGPLNLPKPDQMPLDPRPRFAVADYLLEPTIYRRWFFPELENALGPLWPLILIGLVAALYLAFAISESSNVRVLGRPTMMTGTLERWRSMRWITPSVRAMR